MIASSTLQCLFVALILFLNAVESNNPKSDQVSQFSRLFYRQKEILSFLRVLLEGVQEFQEFQGLQDTMDCLEEMD